MLYAIAMGQIIIINQNSKKAESSELELFSNTNDSPNDSNMICT